MSNHSSKNKTRKDYEELGKMLESIYEMGYVGRRQMYKMSFVKGVVAGFGGVVGATLIVTLVVAILNIFHYVPFVHYFTDTVKDSVQHSGKK